MTQPTNYRAVLEQALLPCPFCGGTDIEEKHRHDYNSVKCKSCRATMAQSDIGYGDAGKLWNRRHIQPPLTAGRAALEQPQGEALPAGLERCEFNDSCDFCNAPEQGVFTRLIHNAEDCTEAEFYICGGCLFSAIPPKPHPQASEPAPSTARYSDIVSDGGMDPRNSSDEAAAALLEAQPKLEPLTGEQVEWVTNDNAELGVKIGQQFFFLYKGASLVYEEALHDDGTPMMWRKVGKREFGECCYPVKFYRPGAVLPSRYTDTLDFVPGLSFGEPGDADWRPLPAAHKIGGQG